MKILKSKLEIAKKGQIKCLLISDIHLGESNVYRLLKKLEKIATKTDTLYDAIFLLGDLVDSTDILKDDYLSRDIVELLKNLSVRAPLYIVTGNHDLCSLKVYKETKRTLTDRVTFRRSVLNNLTKSDKIFKDIGTFPLKENFTVSIYNPPLQYIKSPEHEREEVLKNDADNYKFLDDLDPSKTNILISHYPDIIKWLHKENRLSHIDICLAGHNHGGMTQNVILETIFRILNWKTRGLITPDKSMKPEDTEDMRGLITLDKNTLLYINPAFTSLSPNTGLLRKFNFLFYRGMTEMTISKKTSNNGKTKSYKD